MSRKQEPDREKQSFLTRIGEAAAAIADAGEAVFSLSSSLREQDLDEVIWQAAMPKRSQRGETMGQTRRRGHAKEVHHRSNRYADPRGVHHGSDRRRMAQDIVQPCSPAEVRLCNAMREGDMESVMTLSREVDAERSQHPHATSDSDSVEEERNDGEGSLHASYGVAQQEWTELLPATMRGQPPFRSGGRIPSRAGDVKQHGYAPRHVQGRESSPQHIRETERAASALHARHRARLALDGRMHNGSQYTACWDRTRHELSTLGGCDRVEADDRGGRFGEAEGGFCSVQGRGRSEEDTSYSHLLHSDPCHGMSQLSRERSAHADDELRLEALPSHVSDRCCRNERDWHGCADRESPKQLELSRSGREDVQSTRAAKPTATLDDDHALSGASTSQSHGRESSFHMCEYVPSFEGLPRVELCGSEAFCRLLTTGVQQLVLLAHATAVPSRSGGVTLLHSRGGVDGALSQAEPPMAGKVAATVRTTTGTLPLLEDVTERSAAPHSPQDRLGETAAERPTPPSPSIVALGHSRALSTQQTAALQAMRDEGKDVRRVGAISMLTNAEVKQQLALRGPTATAGIAANNGGKLRERLAELVRAEVLAREASGEDDIGSEDETLRLKGLGLGRKIGAAGDRCRRVAPSSARPAEDSDEDGSDADELQAPDVHKVDRILDMRTLESGGREFLIKWQGWSARWNGVGTCTHSQNAQMRRMHTHAHAHWIEITIRSGR